MKKLLLSILSTFLIVGSVSATTYIVQQGDTLSSIGNKFGQNWQELLARNPKIKNPNLIYTGEKIGIDTPILGAGNPVTATDWTLAQRLTSSASDTTIYLTSIKDLRDNNIATSSLPYKVYFMIEAENFDNAEIVVCPQSGYDQVNKKFAGCTRGLAFYGSTETAVTANIKEHSSGVSVNMTNVGQFYNLFGGIYDDNTWTKNNTFNALVTFLIPPVGVTPTTTNQLATKYYVDNVGAGGFTAGNIGNGATIRANGTSPETIDINTSTDEYFILSDKSKFIISTSTSSKLEKYWNDRYNATTTWGGGTVGGNFTVNANATTTGNQYISGSLTVDGGIINPTDLYKSWAAASSTSLRASANVTRTKNSASFTTIKQISLLYSGTYVIKWQQKASVDSYRTFTILNTVGASFASPTYTVLATSTPSYKSFEQSIFVVATSTPMIISLNYASEDTASNASVRNFQIYYNLIATSSNYLIQD